MKKILLSLLTCISLNLLALVGDSGYVNNRVGNGYGYSDEHNFYAAIINNSKNTKVDIYTKNSLHWDNWGWCDGAGQDKLSVNPGQTKVYCGGTTQYLRRMWSDTPRLQHEWWFNKNGKWEQNYSEQWLSYMWEYKSSENITKIVENNNWDSAIDFKVWASYCKILSIPTDTIVIYEINEAGNSMKVSCFSAFGGVNWRYVDTMRQGQNLCPGADGKERTVWF